MELKRGSYAGSFLRIISDPHFCSALVRRSPWLAATAVQRLADCQQYSRDAVDFIQELGSQAILNDDSMVTKEVRYEGFGTAPILSESLFGSWFMVVQYRPLAKLRYETPAEVGAGYVKRLNYASEMILSTCLKEMRYWMPNAMDDVAQVYENLFRKLGYRSESEAKEIPFELQMGVVDLARRISSGFEELDRERRFSLFARNSDRVQRNLVSSVAEVACESLASIANTFSGYDDANWLHAIGVMMEVFPSHGAEPDGMDPLQQQIAIRLVKNLERNMSGWYPAVSRVLISTIGPYRDNSAADEARPASSILMDAVYLKLKKLPDLIEKDPEQLKDFLPSNVTYDADSRSLIHTFSDGATETTHLDGLVIQDVDLFDEVNWR